MPDNHTKIGEPSGSPIAGEPNNVVRYLTEKYGLKRKWVQNLINNYGKDRHRLEQAARELTGA